MKLTRTCTDQTLKMVQVILLPYLSFSWTHVNAARGCPEGKAILSLAEMWMRQTAVSWYGESVLFLMTPYTRQFKKVSTLALALNCSCSALEFKWPACGFQSPLPVPLSFSWPLVVLLCSIPYGFPLTFLQSSPSVSLCQSLAIKRTFSWWYLFPYLYLDQSEKSGKAPKYFLFVLFLEMLCM